MMKLFEPITIRSCTLKNRIFMPGMGTNFRLRNARARAYYEERARGGVGAIVVGGIMCDLMADSAFANSFYDWVGAPVQKHGTKIGPELWFGNMYPSHGNNEILQEYVAPSPGFPRGARAVPIIYPDTDCYCRELTKEEIADIISRYAAGALMAQKIGFDFIEIHACHGHNLPHQFFSPLDNRRTDEYGKSLEGRMRFSIELTRAVKNATGEDFPLFWRLCAEEGLPGGYTLQEALQLGQHLGKAGVDLLDVSFGHEAVDEVAPLALFYPCPGEESREAPFLSFAAAFKRTVKIPVVAVGRLHSPDLAERVLQEGKADIVALGRQLLADPFWPEKVGQKHYDTITPCLTCNYCIDLLEKGEPIKCSVNPYLGRENELRSEPLAASKKVLIIGGGVAGMQAAIIAAARGHKVTLCEQKSFLGGQLQPASRLLHKSKIAEYQQFLVQSVYRAGVDVRCNFAVTVTKVDEMNPDAIVLATGAVPVMPSIPGIEFCRAIFAVDVLTEKVSLGQRVIVIGGGEVGCETAEYLANQGRKVIVLEVMEKALPNLPYRFRHHLLYRLALKGVSILSGVRCQSISNSRVELVDRHGNTRSLGFDSLVVATGSARQNELEEELRGRGKEMFLVGDCLSPRTIADASFDGAKAGSRI